MPTSIITSEDLNRFKIELIEELKKLLDLNSIGTQKKYYKSSDVMEILNISRSTLQNLRVNGSLPYTKIGNIFYYDLEEIQSIMNANKSHHNIE